jgi:hypothetical protein
MRFLFILYHDPFLLPEALRLAEEHSTDLEKSLRPVRRLARRPKKKLLVSKISEKDFTPPRKKQLVSKIFERDFTPPKMP